MTLDDLPLVLTPTEFGTALRWGRTTTWRWIREHPDRVVRFGTLVRIPRSVLEEMLAGRGNGGGAR